MAGGVGAYIALMRPKNLVLAGATVPLGAYFALMDTSEAFPFVAVTLHTLAVMLFTGAGNAMNDICLLYTSPSPRDNKASRMPSSA